MRNVPLMRYVRGLKRTVNPNGFPTTKPDYAMLWLTGVMVGLNVVIWGYYYVYS